MDRTELIAQAKAIAESRITDAMDADEKMDVLETAMIQLLDIQIMKPPVGRVGTIAAGGGQPSTGHWLMGDDPRLPKMPEHPTLMDFFRLRFQQDTYGSNHLLQSARLARDKGLPGHLVLACLLHDISVIGFIRTDHGHWAAQMIEPYVTEEATWAVRHHQALRFRPASDYDFDYPALYTRVFGDDYDPPAYIKAEWDYCRTHKWYDSAMQIVVNDLYAFDPDKVVLIEEFEDIIAEHFRQPEDGLGFDRSPAAHIWRTMIWPNNFL